MPMRIIDITPDISSAYADALAKMETAELTTGTAITRGASLAYKLTVEKLLTEVHYGPRDNLEWPRRATYVSAILSDIELEYLKLYHATEDKSAVRFALDEAACALEKLADLVKDIKSRSGE